MKWFLLFLIPLLCGFGVSPEQLVLQESASLYVVAGDEPIVLFFESDVLATPTSVILQPYEQKEVVVHAQSRGNGFLRISDNASMSASLRLPVTTPQKRYWPIVVFNLFGLCVGVFLWKKNTFFC